MPREAKNPGVGQGKGGGHPLWHKGMARVPGSGRKPGIRVKRAALMEYIERLEKEHNLPTADPVELLIFMAAVGKDPLMMEAHIRGEIGITQTYLPLDVRVDAAKAAAPFVRPKLQATAISAGKDDNVGFENVVTEQVMANREMRDIFERMQVEAAQVIAANPDEFEEDGSRAEEDM